jgi:hypothetical protein
MKAIDILILKNEAGRIAWSAYVKASTKCLYVDFKE